MPVVEDSLQLVGSGRLHLQRVFRSDVVAVKRRLRAGIFGVEERKQNRPRFHAHVDAFNHQLYQRFRQVIRQVPEHDGVELLPFKAKVLGQKPVNIECLLTLPIRYDERRIGGQPQQIFLVEAMPQSDKESDVGGRCGAQVEHAEAFFARHPLQKLAEADRAAQYLLARHNFACQALLARAAKNPVEHTWRHWATLYGHYHKNR